MFCEQQKNAFYDQHFDNLTFQELESAVNKYKAKKGQEEFPIPENIFYKNFWFLDSTLKEILLEREINEKKNEVKKVETPKEKLVIAIKKEPVKVQNKKQIISKLGVKLEEESDMDSDNSFIIPKEFNDLIENSLNGKKAVKGKDIDTMIETAPITKRELREFQSQKKWVDELVDSDNEKLTSVKKTNKDPLIILTMPLIFNLSNTKENLNVVFKFYYRYGQIQFLEILTM